ncbi:podocin [Anguilla anguilla]|uniref:podocin n=1 Tax=Anguilla anguilla TaxID=7936 RepID=UPI0015B3565C|nr:podocin [Anguilla anguilla]
MVLAVESFVSMDRKSSTASPRRSPREGRELKRDKSHASGGRHHKTSKAEKLPQKVRKNGEPNEEPEASAKTEELQEGSDKPHSTVVNVDSVRDTKGQEETEESLGLLEREWQEEGVKSRRPGVCEWLLTGLAILVVILSFPLSIWLCLKIVKEHERAVILRLGHLLPGKPRGPGLLFYLPLLDVCQNVDIRLKMLKVPSHTVVTKDLVSTELSAVCYYRIENVSLCFTSLSGVSAVLQGLVQASDREVLARHTFTQILLERKKIAQEIQVALDAVTCQWGIKVERAEIEDLCVPAELQHSVAAEAQAKRLAQIKVIAAEGEKAACEALKASMDSLSGSPAAVQLRILQLMHTLRTEHPALVLTLPSDLLTLPADLSAPPSPANHSLPADSITNDSHRDSPMM